MTRRPEQIREENCTPAQLAHLHKNVFPLLLEMKKKARRILEEQESRQA